MPTIQEIRQKYPQYNQLTDTDLADRLHAKYYAQMPKEEFYSKVGLATEQPAQSKVSNLFPHLNPLDTVRNLAAGMAEGGANIGDAPLRLMGFKPPQINMEEQFGVTPENKNEFAQGIGKYAPLLAGGGLLSGTPLRSIGSGALYGAAQNPENPIGGAAVGGLTSVVPAIPKGNPYNLLSSPLSREELLRNFEAARGTETGLGDIIASPTLKRGHENILTKVLFSGANPAMQRTGVEIANRGQNILDRYRNEVPHENVSDRLKEALVNAHREQTNIKSNLYRTANGIADRSGFQLSTPSFSRLANQHAQGIEATNVLQFEPETAALLNKLRRYQGITRETRTTGALENKAGQPLLDETVTTPPSLQEANLLAGRLNEIAEKNAVSTNMSDRNVGRVMGQLGRALKSDIRNAVLRSGNKDLRKAWFRAERNYAENYSEFLDKDILKAVHGDELPEDVLHRFLKTSRVSDKSGQLNKLMSKLSPNDQDLVRYSYFSRALEGPEDMQAVNPNKLKTLWNKLGSNQKRVLVPDRTQRRQLDNYSLLVSMNPKSVNMMLNPATGQANLDLISGLMALHPVKALPEIGLARRATRFLTNEDTRRRVVQHLLDRQGGNNATRITL